MSRSRLMNSALCAAFMAAICASTPAMALEVKQCLPMAEMNTALRAEGQRTMIIGDREALQNPTGKIADASILRFVNTVTSNQDGSVGYQLEGNLPRSEVSTTVCVRAKLTNVQLFDARRPSLPQAVLLGGEFEKAIRESADEKGTRPMVYADTVFKRADGSERVGLPMVIIGNIPHKTAFMVTRLANGKPTEMMQMADTEYTQAGLQRIGTQVAMREP